LAPAKPPYLIEVTACQRDNIYVHLVSSYHGLMDKDVVELMKLHEELANIRHGQKIILASAKPRANA
jgi:hypothetical protein